MSNYIKPSSEGDRIDIGGKLPQFDAFAWFVYKELINNNLEWIKIGDPEALTIDDIQYSNRSEIHAYQVKWSNLEKPRPISFSEFTQLIPSFITSWKALKYKSAKEKKELKIYLLTNRPLSQNDKIVENEKSLGSFKDFHDKVWQPFKVGNPIDLKWRKKIISIFKQLAITKCDFRNFCKDLEIITSFTLPSFKNTFLSDIQKKKDLQDISRIIIDELADKKKNIFYPTDTLINLLGWGHRFKTTFQHELIVDKQRYQPISATIDKLNEKIDRYDSGYIFLLGTPGSGKSTLINQWSKQRKERISKYYAFDFTNPSSILNNSERGEASNLFYDLIYQLRSSIPSSLDVLPFKSDLTYLIETFNKLLDLLHVDFIDTGRKTIIIVDGLDHVPREYKSVTKTFLSYLPQPSFIPKGIVFILGSQTFELEHLSSEIRNEAMYSERKIQIAPLEKKSVFKYIDSCETKTKLTETQKEKIYEISEGHPLYLSYLIETIKSSTKVDSTLSEFPVIDGYIDNYYNKIWQSISSNNQLIIFLGLIARINGNINPKFIDEWRFDNVYPKFKVVAANLFDHSEGRWSFFHNSFRQFLIYNTSINLLTSELDKNKDIDFHVKLVKFYKISKIEPKWKCLFHLYIIGEYEELVNEIKINGFNEFVNIATAESFVEQLLSYRPVEEIRNEIATGIKIAKIKKDICLLTRFILCSAELGTRIDYLDPASFIKLYLNLGKNQIAKDYLRFENRLYCSKQFALEAARLFYDVGDKVEAKLLFMLAEPEAIYDNSILIGDMWRFDELKEILEEWVKTATLFYSVSEILLRLRNITFSSVEHNHRHHESPETLKIDLIYELSIYIISTQKWADLTPILTELNLSDKNENNLYFYILYKAIENCLESNETQYASFFLSELLKIVVKAECSNTRKIYIADIIYKTLHDIDLVIEWLNDVEQPKLPDLFHTYDNRFNLFVPKIKYNKLLNILGRSVSMKEAIPDPINTQDNFLVEFERMLFLITKLYTDGLQNKPLYGNISEIVRPIVEFYYKDVRWNRDYWYEITTLQDDYTYFLIDALSKCGNDYLSDFATYIFSEFDYNSSFWNTSLKRSIIVKLYEIGYDKNLCFEQLKSLEDSMLEGLDINGRVTECSNQARTWLKFNNLINTEYWVKKAIQESIGIGYSKDYQFNTWIKWLRKINKAQPENTKERQLWFLSHLQFIKDTTESAYWDMSEELLHAALEWNFVNGIEQLIWQLENGLITFKDAIAITIEHSLNSCNSIEVYNLTVDLFIKILLPISNEQHVKLIDQICECGYLLYAGLFQPKINELISSIKVLSLEESRKAYFETIALFLKKHNINVDENILKYSKKTRDISDSLHEMNIVLKSTGERLTENDVLLRINSYNDLKKMLLDNDKVNSYFDWTNVIEKLANSLKAIEILELSTMYNSEWRKAFYLANLSRFALNLNETILAKDLANEAIKESKASGWVKRYDGGTRSAAFKALISVSKLEGHETAFNVFCEDLINSHPGFYAEYLDDILQIISDSVNLPKIWKEIEGYLNRIMVNSSRIPNLPDFKVSINSLNQGMVNLLLYLSKLTVPLVNIEAQKILASYAKLNNIQLLEEIKKLSEKSETEQELFINILLFMNCIVPSSLTNFLDELKQLCHSENYFIRYNSIALIEKIDSRFRISFPYRELNPLYNLFFQPENGFEVYDEMQYTEFVKDTENPHHLLKIINFHIELLKDFTGIEVSNFEYRIIAFIKNNGRFSQMSSEVEKKIRWLLKEINLNYSYHRPRALVAQNALMHVLTELLDSQTLNNPAVLRYFDFTDHQVEVLNEIEKPTFIQILDPENKHSFNEEWINSIESHERLGHFLSLYENNWHVIGEYSLVRCLYWGTPTEEYNMQISNVHISKKMKDKKDFFKTVFHCKVTEYLEYPYFKPENIIILNNHMFNQFDLKAKWIAFNPALATKLGWLPDGSKIFAWKNTLGSTMVESIFWRNGNVNMPAPQLYSEAGEGWLVVCSKEALQQIADLFPNMVIEKKLIREVRNDDKELYKEYSNEFPMNTE